MNTQEPVALKRSISLSMLIFYGLGTMVGGGIYALLGKVAGEAGMFAPVSFAISAFIALLTAFSYAELSSRYPTSAGEVQYVRAAFSWPAFSTFVGWLVVFMGLVSASALVNATAGFIEDFIPFSRIQLVIGVSLSLGMIAAWGITQSVILILIATVVSLLGLLYVIIMGAGELASLSYRLPEMIPTSDALVLGSVFSGAFLAFYAFIGFEDMVNIAEEVKDVRRSMPIAIIVCIIATTLIYALVMAIAVLAVPPQELAESNTPLRTIMDHLGGDVSPHLMGIISIFATINGALVQIIMGSRVLYGMARTNKAPAFLGHVSPRTQTPLKATAILTFVVLLLALFFNLEALAKITSAVILFTFFIVNVALLKIKWAGTSVPESRFSTPWWVCACASITCLMMFLFGTGKELMKLF